MPKPLRLQPVKHTFTSRSSRAGVPYELTFKWNYRMQDWRVTIQNTSSLEWLCADRRISPGRTTAGFPDGAVLWPVGPDPYKESDLGGALNVWLLSAEDLATLIAPSDPDPTLV
jgi:hypothetical protein